MARAKSNGLVVGNFQDFLNLTPNCLTDSAIERRGDNQAIMVQDSPPSEHTNLLLRYNDVSRCLADAQDELRALKSSTTLSSTAVLSDMYTDLNRSYEELEASYKRVLESNEPLRAEIAQLQHDLLAANDRLVTVRHEFRLQQSELTDLQVRFHMQSQSMADVTAKCSELQKLSESLQQMLDVAEADLQDARSTIHRLNADIRDANEVTEELSEQAS